MIVFCVGTQLVGSGVRPLLTTIYISTLAVISPIGAGIGLGLSESAQELSSQTAAITVLQGLATGTLLYVVFFEIIEKERKKGTNGILMVLALTKILIVPEHNCDVSQITFLVLGFACILLLQLVEAESSGGHGHSHAAELATPENDHHHEHEGDHDDHHEHGGAHQQVVCMLKHVDSSWVLPKYFSCDQETGVLRPVEWEHDGDPFHLSIGEDDHDHHE